MHYAIRARGKRWALVCREFSVETKKTTERTVLPGSSEWAQFGLNPDLSFTDAKRIWKETKALRADDWVNRIRARNDARKASLKAITAKYFPDGLVAKFEQEIIPELHLRSDRWLLVKELFADIDLAPQDWHWRPGKIFSIFESKAYHPSYTLKLLKILNTWGAYYCRELDVTFLPVSRPTSETKIRLSKAHAARIVSGHKPDMKTRPLRLNDLAELSSTMPEKQHRGLKLMFWLGLRKREVKQLLITERGEKIGGWWLEKDDARFPVLHLFQDKLYDRGIKAELCWKAIPICIPEQVECLPVIETRNFDVPVGYNTRRARLGFSIHMEELGYLPDLISDWLGHVGPNTRDKHYKERRRARWVAPVKIAG